MRAKGPGRKSIGEPSLAYEASVCGLCWAFPIEAVVVASIDSFVSNALAFVALNLSIPWNVVSGGGPMS